MLCLHEFWSTNIQLLFENQELNDFFSKKSVFTNEIPLAVRFYSKMVYFMYFHGKETE